jgi:hypothetical protein
MGDSKEQGARSEEQGARSEERGVRSEREDKNRGNAELYGNDVGIGE